MTEERDRKMEIQIPQIREDRGIPTLYVKGRPFIALAGEVHNSSSASLTYMEQKVWPYLEGMHLNTLVVPIAWETIEPEEGSYDFTVLEGLVRQASQREMHLVLLWFGLWKNAESMYVPGWVKKDTETYFRVEKVTGEKLNTVSPFCEEAVRRDARAFSHMMEHLYKIDGSDSTVIMVQVENEVGLLGSARDYCQAAQKAFEGQVPPLLLQEEQEAGNRQKAGSWREVFGEDAEECFMAYHFAAALEQITRAGQKAYPLPCFVNVWLKQHPWYPGSYPSGGPVREMHRIWKKTAPSLFCVAPDIYVPYVPDVMEEYSYEGNPLMIPEIRKDVVTASYALYAVTHYNALCYSPFGIEDLGAPPETVTAPPPELIAELKMDPLSFDLRGSREALSDVYRMLKELMPLYLEYRGTPHMRSYLKKNEHDLGSFHRFSEYDVEITYFPKADACPPAAGVILELAPNRFLILGMMSQFRITAKEGTGRKADFLRKESGTIVEGRWQPWQPQNGDERGITVMGRGITCHMVEMFQY